jgi:hypothetical protein
MKMWLTLITVLNLYQRSKSSNPSYLLTTLLIVTTLLLISGETQATAQENGILES